MSESPERPVREPRPLPDQRLESWKEIAAYLRRGVRTVRRWEKEEGLPVHRQVHRTLATVYAHRSELDAWRESRRAADVRPAGRILPRNPVGSSRVMIAVLPFDDLSGDGEQEYVADGLTEEIIGQLGRFNPGALGVIARTTTMRYRQQKKTIREIGAELAVAFVVEGSLRREGDLVRVTAQLIDSRDQSHRWSGTYERRMPSILALQRDLARSIGSEIGLTLSPRPAAEPARAAVNPDAYLANLKGRHFLYRFTPESVRRSVEYFLQAIEEDPDFAPAHASLAEAYEQLSMWGDEPAANLLPSALSAAERAHRLEPDLPEAHASMGLISVYYLWDWPRAEQHFRRALELNPGCLPARLWQAEFLAAMGRIDEALETIDRASRHDPLASSIQAARAYALLMGRRFDEAIDQARRALEIEPDSPMALIRLGLASVAAGRIDEAIQALQRARASAPELLDCTSLLGYAHAAAGRADAARSRLDDLDRLSAARYVPPFLFANVHIGLGDHEKALDRIEQEYDARGWYLVLLARGPQFDPLRPHPRFQALARRMRFPVGAP